MVSTTKQIFIAHFLNASLHKSEKRNLTCFKGILGPKCAYMPSYPAPGRLSCPSRTPRLQYTSQGKPYPLARKHRTEQKDHHDPDNHCGVITHLEQTSWRVKSSGP